MKGLSVLGLLLLFEIAKGFSANSRLASGTRQSLTKPALGAVTSNFDGDAVDTSRRNTLAALLLVTSAGVVGSITPSPTTSANNNVLVLSSVDEALTVIEANCDRRYLHGVVASDYKCMYRGIPTGSSSLPRVVSSTSNSDLILSSSDYASLEEYMADKRIKPSNGQLAFTSPGLVKDGEAASIWPLGDDVHFAWSEDGDLLQNSAGKVIVDGVDCGRMALEDALEGKDREIMFRADRYLAVPVSLQDELLTGLRGAFII